MIHHRPLLALLCLMLPACNSVAPGSTAPTRRILSAADSSAHLPGYLRAADDQVVRLVIRDSAAWQTQWTYLVRGVRPPPPRPAIDFRQETVVLVSAGSFPGTGPFIRIDSAHADRGTARVFVRTGRCRGPWFGGDMQVHPLDAVRLPGRFHRVHFVEQETTFPGCSDRAAP